jgi:hypothetical protein
MRARLRCFLTTAQRAADGMPRVAVIIEHEVRMPARAGKPVGNFIAVLFEYGAHNALGRFTIRVSRGGGDVRFAVEALAEFDVSSAYVLAQGMSTRLCVLRQIVSGSGAERPGRRRVCIGAIGRWPLAAGEAENKNQDCGK